MIDASGPVHDFDRFFEAAYDRALRMATVMLAGDRALAEEVVSEVFFSAYKGWAAIENPSAWVTSVIARRVIKLSKDSRRRQPLLGRLWASARSGDHTDPILIAQHREDARRVLQQLAVLPAQQRTVAVLWWLHDWQQKDIAEYLHMKPSSVSTHIRRAEQTMRRIFGPRGESLNLFSGSEEKGGQAL